MKATPRRKKRIDRAGRKERKKMATNKQTSCPECSAFVEARGIPGVFLFLREPLQQRHVFSLREMLQGTDYEQLDLIVHSGGGDIHAAYQAIEILRMHTKTLNACVPLLAKSAATLLCLGCDNIFLDEMAELGPLDTQIVERKRGGKMEFASALNPFKTLEQLQKFSVETLGYLRQGHLGGVNKLALQRSCALLSER